MRRHSRYAWNHQAHSAAPAPKAVGWFWELLDWVFALIGFEKLKN
jgi:hypothetical protein